MFFKCRIFKLRPKLMKIKLKSFGNRKQSFNTPGRFGYEINSLHITKLKYLSKSKPLNDLATPNKHQILPERFQDFPLIPRKHR